MQEIYLEEVCIFLANDTTICKKIKLASFISSIPYISHWDKNYHISIKEFSD